jgi:hypothetical protein
MSWVVLENVMTSGQLEGVKVIFWKVIQFVVSWIYSLVTTIVDVLTDPAVVGALVVVALIFIAYRWIKRKQIGG